MKKFILAFLKLTFVFTPLFAGSHSGKITISSTCTAKHFQVRLMKMGEGQMPLQAVGEQNCFEYVVMADKGMDMNSSCTYSALISPGETPMNNFTNSCHAFDADGDAMYWRYSGTDEFGKSSGSGQVTIFGGTGKFQGISGKLNSNWQQAVQNAADPTRWGATAQAIGSFKK